MHDKWMKEWFFKPCVHTPYPKRIYIIPNYLSVLKLQNYSLQCSSCAFFTKIEEKLLWIIKCSQLHNSLSYIKLVKTPVSRGLMTFKCSNVENVDFFNIFFIIDFFKYFVHKAVFPLKIMPHPFWHSSPFSRFFCIPFLMLIIWSSIPLNKGRRN